MQTFHGACVGLTKENICSINGNVIWLCDDCLSAFYDHQKKLWMTEDPPADDAPQKLYETVADLTDKIANIEKMLSAMSTVNESSISPSNSSVPQHSTPIRQAKLRNGSRRNETNCSIQNCLPRPQRSSDSSCSVRHSEDSFSLFLTNIDGQVTEEEINVLVAESLGVEGSQSFHVKKLVPKWMKDDSLDYASFKVTVDPKFKSAMLQESTWPTGIKYREFIERPRNTWKPCR